MNLGGFLPSYLDFSSSYKPPNQKALGSDSASPHRIFLEDSDDEDLFMKSEKEKER